MVLRTAPGLKEYRQELAGLIDGALKRGQHHDPHNLWYGQPWTNEGFGRAVHATESAVRSWRDKSKSSRPANIVSILEVFFGDNAQFSETRREMHNAWRRAGGFVEDDLPPQHASTIDSKRFSDVAQIVDLSVGQPLPNNADNSLLMPFTLNIYPDPHCEVDGKKVEIGVTAAFVMIESEHWQPHQESVFCKKNHPNIKKDATPGGVQVVGPTDDKGRIAGEPLADEPVLKIEPKRSGASSPVEVSVRVFRDGFTVTPRDAPEVSETQELVLDAIFSEAFARDANRRLIVATETIRPAVRVDT